MCTLVTFSEEHSKCYFVSICGAFHILLLSGFHSIENSIKIIIHSPGKKGDFFFTEMSSRRLNAKVIAKALIESRVH